MPPRSPRFPSPGRRAVGPLILALGAGCGPSREPGSAGEAGRGAGTAPEVLRGGALRDEAAERGLAYVNRSGGVEKHTILEVNGPGVALLDLGADGDLDAVFGQGPTDRAAFLEAGGADLEVFENRGAGSFARRAGPGLRGWWSGLATGDVDGDGDTDLVAGALGDLVLLRQDAEGALVPAPESGLAPPPGSAPWTTSLAFLDADRDGTLDLYACRYVAVDPRDPPQGSLGEGALSLPCWWKGHAVFCGPRGLAAEADAVFRGLGDGRFADASEHWLAAPEPAYGLGVVPLDADGDGDTDLYVANDSQANRLFVNELTEGGVLRDAALAAGVALDPDGRPEAGMGVAVGDVDRDGRLDLALTNFSDEPTQLYLGAPVGFTSATYRLGLARATRRFLSWGVHLADLDGDGALELFTANGHVYPQADAPGTGTSYAQPDGLFLRDDEGRFRSDLAPASELLDAPTVSRASALGDVDGDGAPDLVVVRLDGPAALGMNRLAPAANRLLVRCLGPRTPAADAPRTPPDGTGTRVVCVPRVAADREPFALLAEVSTAGSFQAASSPWLHFGLGSATDFEELTVLWPSGATEVLSGGPANRRLWIQEGRGIVREEPLR